MKKRLLGCIAFAAVLSVEPAFAGFVYVPILNRTGSGGSVHSTEIWLSNSGTQERRYGTYFLAAGGDGTKRTAPSIKATLLAGRTSKLVTINSPNVTGLLEIEAGTQVLVEARLASSPASGFAAYTEVPVISSNTMLPAGTAAHLQALSRDASGAYSDLDVVNLANLAATCSIQFFRADGSQIGSTATISVPPLALRHFPDALGTLGETALADARAQVSCNRAFFAFAAVFNPARTLLSFVTPSASGASTLAGPNGPGPSPDAILFEQSGQVHKAVLGQAIKIVKIAVPQALLLKKITVELDVSPGPWNATKPDGNHNLLWLHRGKYRSNTVANVNTFGPPRSGIKNTQNLDMAARALTQQEVPLVFQEGVTYHLKYVYDADANKINLTVTSAGATLATLDMDGSVLNKVISVPATGLVLQLGHTAEQAAGGIEYPSYGWTWSNLLVEMQP